MKKNLKRRLFVVAIKTLVPAYTTAKLVKKNTLRQRILRKAIKAL